ncbi:two-component system sensor histidine kinase NtrB [Oleidesulfovibrio sp.]|uniref:two-component system sensor histidine kinase NtrB n=1 Tax=Oleidesulfovibrio sp. TaxID=2909707 RepID=UPI003A8B191C
MEVADYKRERSTLIIAVLTLVTVGLSLIVSTGQVLSQQEDAGMQHLILASRSVLQAVDSSLRRSMTIDEAGDATFGSGAAEFFRELEQSGEVLFVGLIDKHGGRVLTSRASGESGTILFPPDALRTLAQSGEWHGRVGFGVESAYVYGKRILPGNTGSMSIPRAETGEPLPAFLVVGLDMAKHQAIYRKFRQNALFQAAYILGAAVLIWALAMGLIKRREMAGKARQLERFQVKLLDNLPDGLVTVGMNGTIMAANPAANGILQARGDGLAGKILTDLPDEMRRCLAAPDSETAGWRQESVRGAHLEILSVKMPESGDAEEPSRLVILRDRTQIRTLEKSLSDAEKLAAVGTLAAGVAHEIRNPLSALRGFAQYFAKKFKEKQPEEVYAQTMVREADRLNRVITDLLYLARPRRVSPRLVPLRRLISEVEDLVRFDLDERKISLVVSLGPEEVWADEDTLKQALLNLVLNSLDALRESNSPVRQVDVASGMAKDGVWVFVRDTAGGMTKEQAEQAFEPFYTTKKKGTGLGLALVHKTMRDHGGKAIIDSLQGQGTTVGLFFPEVDTTEDVQRTVDETERDA